MDNAMFARLFEILGERTGEHAAAAKSQSFASQTRTMPAPAAKITLAAAANDSDVRKFNIAEEFAAERNLMLHGVVTEPKLKRTVGQIVTTFKNGVSNILRFGGDFLGQLVANADLGTPQAQLAPAPSYGGNVLEFRKRGLS